MSRAAVLEPVDEVNNGFCNIFIKSRSHRTKYIPYKKDMMENEVNNRGNYFRHLMSYRQPTICYVFHAWQDMFHFEMNIRKGEMDFLKFNISVFNSLERFLPVRKYDPMTQFPAREENN